MMVTTETSLKHFGSVRREGNGESTEVNLRVVKAHFAVFWHIPKKVG